MPAHRLTPLLAAGALLAGCGSASSTPQPAPAHARTPGSAAPGSTTAASAPATQAAPSGPGALSADARSAATGDIPDNQVFLVYASRSAGFSIKYPEGWTVSGAGGAVTFRDKNNLVRVLIRRGTAPSAASVASQLSHQRGQLTFTPPQPVSVGATGTAIKTVYRTESAPNPVTGKRVVLVVDRYALARGGRVAVIDLGTPVEVDNVDAYRLMIQSFTWR